jgi:hypothetical protein
VLLAARESDHGDPVLPALRPLRWLGPHDDPPHTERPERLTNLRTRDRRRPDVRDDDRSGTTAVDTDRSGSDPARGDGSEVGPTNDRHDDEPRRCEAPSKALGVDRLRSGPGLLRDDKNVDAGFDRPSEPVVQGHDLDLPAREGGPQIARERGPSLLVRPDPVRQRLRVLGQELRGRESDPNHRRACERGGEERLVPHVETVERPPEHRGRRPTRHRFPLQPNVVEDEQEHQERHQPVHQVGVLLPRLAPLVEVAAARLAADVRAQRARLATDLAVAMVVDAVHGRGSGPLALAVARPAAAEAD